jgi:hypothetical protein
MNICECGCDKDLTTNGECPICDKASASTETPCYVPSVSECLDVIAQLAKATRAQATATQKESMVVKVARQRAEKFLIKNGM